MKGVVNIEFVLSIVAFLSTISFVTFIIINNMPFLHNEAASEHVETRLYQISHMLMFNEGFPSTWDRTTVNRVGLSNGRTYELSSLKINELNQLCNSDYEKLNNMLGELGIFVNINITKLETGEGLTDNCAIEKTGLKFIINRFAVVDGDLVRMRVSLTAK